MVTAGDANYFRHNAGEELGTEAFTNGRPLFLTVTMTRGERPHTDVSLWYLLAGHRGMRITLDRRESNGGRWWGADKIAAADPELFDPHMGRFLGKARAAFTG